MFGRLFCTLIGAGPSTVIKLATLHADGFLPALTVRSDMRSVFRS
jgi:hypothetical protein